MEIWDRDELSISAEWDNIYSVTYMELMASSGLKGNDQSAAIAKAYEHACLEILKKHKISFDSLDKILQDYSQVLNKKNK